MESSDYLRRYVQDENGCWNYTGSINRRGYGQIRQTTAHRFFWTELRGPIPAGLHIDHLCCNTRCVNPEHLEPVFPEENNIRAALRKGGGWPRFLSEARLAELEERRRTLL